MREKAKELFGTAYQFTVAARVLVNQDPPIAYPAISIVALALELQFKTLLLLQGRPVKKIHHLSSLFDKLDGPTKNEVDKEWQALISTGWKKALLDVAAQRDGFDRKLTTALALGADAFEKFRYAHEKQFRSMYLQGLEQNICAMILRKEPDFADKIPKVIFK